MNAFAIEHIVIRLFGNLKHKDILSCKLVCKSWDMILANPKYWLKKLKAIGQPADISQKWMNLLVKAETLQMSNRQIVKALEVSYFQMTENRFGYTDDDEYLNEVVCQLHIFQSPIVVAAKLGLMDEMKLFEEMNEDLDDKHSVGILSGLSPLHKAARSNDISGVKYLIQNGTEIDIQSVKNLETPLHKAVEEGNEEIVEILIQNGADVNAKDIDGSTPIYFAVFNNFTSIAKILMQNGANAEARDSYGIMSLHHAVKSGNAELVEILISEKTDLDQKIGLAHLHVNGPTMLSFAASKNYESVAQVLLRKGADPNAWNNQSHAPIHLVSNLGFTKIVQLLLEYGADPNLKDNDGITPLIHAVNRGNEEIAKILIDYEADVNNSDLLGNVPLHYAVGADKEIRILKLLIENGASLNIKDQDGYTALHHAVHLDLVEYVIVLLQSGASLNVKDHNKRTPIECCFQWKKMNVFRSILALIFK